MRYSGPRMLFRYPLLSLWHFIDAFRKVPSLEKRSDFLHYTRQIDGILIENLLKDEVDEIVYRTIKADYISQDVPVLTIDFKEEDNSKVIIDRARAKGFYPYIPEDASFSVLAPGVGYPQF